MKKIRRFYRRNWFYIIAFVIGGAVTPIAVSAAILEREYSGAVGGEILIAPLIVLLLILYNMVRDAIRYVFKNEHADNK